LHSLQSCIALNDCVPRQVTTLYWDGEISQKTRKRDHRSKAEHLWKVSKRLCEPLSALACSVCCSLHFCLGLCNKLYCARQLVGIFCWLTGSGGQRRSPDTHSLGRSGLSLWCKESAASKTALQRGSQQYRPARPAAAVEACQPAAWARGCSGEGAGQQAASGSRKAGQRAAGCTVLSHVPACSEPAVSLANHVFG